MSLDIGEALKEGTGNLFNRNGLIIIALIFASSILSAIGSQTMVDALTEGSQQLTANANPLSLGLSAPVGGLISLAAIIIGVVVAIAATRTFVSGETHEIPKEYFRRNILFAILNLMIGGLALAIIVTLGLIFLIIPGVFLYVSLYFWSLFVIVEDQNFIEAFKSTWNLTKGNKWNIFGLIAIVFLIVFIINATVGFAVGIAQILGFGAALQVFSTLVTSLTTVFTLAVGAQAFNQLRE
jgi:hypothetical protein